jgi:hypothetical protein
MAYSLSCTSSTVTITNPTGTTSGTLSGTASLQLTDDSTGRAVSTPSIEASGSISQAGTQRISSGGWTLTVTFGRDGSATGSAAGSYMGESLSTNVPVTVGHGGKSVHPHKGHKHSHKP